MTEQLNYPSFMEHMFSFIFPLDVGFKNIFSTKFMLIDKITLITFSTYEFTGIFIDKLGFIGRKVSYIE